MLNLCREGFYRIYGFHREDEAGLVFSIPDYAYPGYVEKAWGRYIEGFVDANTAGFNALQIDPGSFTCLLPHRYRQLRMRGPGQLRALLRSPSDESPEEWQETEKYAIHWLSTEEYAEISFNKGRGNLVIVAFGRKAKLFYYACYSENPPSGSPAPNNTYSSQIAASINDANPANRITQLIPGQEPFDICDMEARKQLEHWIKVFSDGLQKGLEYDPITETCLPFIRNLQKGSKGSDDGDTIGPTKSKGNVEDNASEESEDSEDSEDRHSGDSQDGEDEQSLSPQ